MIATVTDTYEAFFHREFPTMVALAAAVSGSTAIAEDVAQEALARAYRNWEKVVHYDKPGAWLRRVTINLALSARGRASREMKALLKIGPPVGLDESPVIHDEVWNAVRRLPKNQKAAVALHYLEDRPVAEIAEILGCADATARVHLHRGRMALSQMLERDDEN